MLSRLTILTALINLVLSGLIIFTIISIQQNNKAAISTESTPSQVVQTTQKNTSESSEDTALNEQINNTVSPGSQAGGLGSNSSNFVENYVLTNKEMEYLVNSYNPFSSISTNNTTALTQKVENEQSETRSIQESASSTDSNTNTNTEDSVDSELEDKTEKKQMNSVEADKDSSHEEVQKVTELKAKKYDIPSTWLIATIETLSNYKEDLLTQDGNVTREGIMQIRDTDKAFIAKNIGENSNLDESIDANIEMGAYYLSYLAKQTKDKHYPFTVYYLGKEKADKIYKQTGSYESEFSKTVLDKIKKV
ncbi:lytic transglycosylase domain-containing protein [Priestia filamentosa]|uniref:lytic transglycosylase domain-containing protein n=1 Tax=Priestia filamentosa TaxID=1402861 RepID=UPI0005893BB3